MYFDIQLSIHLTHAEPSTTKKTTRCTASMPKNSRASSSRNRRETIQVPGTYSRRVHRIKPISGCIRDSAVPVIDFRNSVRSYHRKRTDHFSQKRSFLGTVPLVIWCLGLLFHDLHRYCLHSSSYTEQCLTTKCGGGYVCHPPR